LMAFLAGATVFSGFGKVVDATTAVVPLLILATLVIGICLLLNFPVKLLWSSPQSAPIPNWVLSSLVYVSYNLTLAISVLAPMGAMAERKKIKRGALLGSAGLGACALVILFAILIRAPFAADAEIPMLLIAGELSAGARVLYTVVLLLEVYTTAIGSLFGFISRLVPTANPWYKPLTVLTALAAFFAARLGFSCIVATVYPLVGLFGLLLLVTLVFDLYKGLK
ncbi:MAG: hypothetical protein GX764_01590, partial [Firmicutes bacterium]|nr:hypothetical protein [Bacillota bacterium]